ncbi:MAG: 30S ribosomal protein S6 [Patescibacteria group bacterium]
MYYEITTIINPEIDEKKVKFLWEKLENDIKSAKLKIEKKVEPFSRSFIYPIKKHIRGHIGTFYCAIEKDYNINAVEKSIKDETSIIRSIIIKINKIPEIKPIKEKNSKFSKTEFIARKKSNNIISGFIKKSFNNIKDNKEKEASKAPIEEIDKKLDQILDDSVKT